MSGTAVTLLINFFYLYLKECTDFDTKSYDFVPFLTLLAYVFIFSVGMQTIPIVVAGELFPTNVKAIALCFLDVMFCGTNAIVSKFFLLFFRAYGMHVPYLIFCICSGIGTVFIISLVPETKGKTLEEIQDDLQEIRARGIDYVLLK